MKLTGHANKLETNAKFTRQEFGIGDVSVVIDILRNRLYKHKIRTLVQEYISNGRDAMRESGTDKAIRVVMPTQFEPTFKVRDYGTGISPDRMRDVFVLYGASTKRDSNSQTGGFGIGAKSAWAYTDSFTIVSYTDGIKRTYIAHTGTNSNGSLDLIDESKTTEDNGTEIQIGVNIQDVDAFRNAVLRCIYFWNEKVDLVGELPNSHKHAGGHRFSDHLEVVSKELIPSYVTNKWASDVLAVIDGIPYPINDELMEKLPMLQKLNNTVKGRLIIHCKTGELDVAATREDISDTSIDKLKKLSMKLFNSVDSHIKSEFKKAKNAFEYLQVYRDLESNFDVSEYQAYGPYKIDGNRIKSDLFAKVQFLTCDNRGSRGTLKKTNENDQKKSRFYNGPIIQLDQFESLYFDVSGESAVKQNKRIRTVLETQDSMVLIMPIKGDAESLKAYKTLKKDLQLKDLSKVAYSTTPVVKSPKVVRSKQEFCVHAFARNRYYSSYGSSPEFVRDTQYITLDSNSQKWLYIVMDGNSFPSKWNKSELYQLDNYLQDYKLCGVSKATHKIIKNDSNFKSLDSWIKEFKPSNTHIQDAKYTKKNSDVEQVLSELTALKGIKDKFLADMIKEYDFKRSIILPKMLMEIVKGNKELNQFIADSDKVEKLIESNYSLLKECFGKYRSVNVTQVNELIHYINAKA